MKRTRSLSHLAVAALLLALPVTALAKDYAVAGATATFIGKLKRSKHGTRASLKVRYRCRSGEVVWVSAKQTASGRKRKALKREGSSQVAATWLQSHRNPLTCDGKKHTARFRVDRREEGSKGRLVAGQAWVQFCITERDEIKLSHSAFVTVRQASGPSRR